MRNFIGCLGLVALMLVGTPVLSQNQTLLRHNWQYGNTTNAIRFNRATNVASIINNKAVPFGNGGSSVATDRENGNLLFYTDGNNVFDINNALMPNGAGLNANAAGNQPTAITPVPGQPGKFFIFTNNASFTAGGTISVSVVDMSLFGTAAFPSPPFGDLESKNIAVPGLINRAEGMITVPHANRRDFWLITQVVGSTNFEATLINAASYTSGTYSTVTSAPASLPTTAAHLAYHQTLRKIAVAPQDPSTDAIILNFNDAAGNITFDRTMLNTGRPSTTDQMIYDIEWSPSGRFLYISRHGEATINADVLQYNYFNSSVTMASVLPGPVFRSFGLQLAPDNQIYHLYQAASGGNFLLGRIESPDSVAAISRYNAAPFGPLQFDARQFPSFLPLDTVELDISFTTAGTCENSPTSFFPRVRPGADSLSWSFGDGQGGRGWGPIHTYEAAGTYNATLRAFYGTQVDSVTQPVQINPFQLQLQLVQDTTACREEFPPPRGSSSPTQFEVTVNISGGTPQSIVWSNGDLGPTLTPDSAGYYYVVVTDASGCSAYAGVNVREYGLEDQIFNKWYFGDRAGIDFSTDPPQALNESAMNAPEGCAIVCDRNGQQIMYTDGNTVYDRNHVVIATGIGGNTASTQSTIIVPVPGDETLYYIFTTQAINGTDSLKLQYALFDLKMNAGDGAVVKQNVLMFMRSTERITSNGRWLIAHEYGNNTFRAYPISPDGIGDPVYSAIGSDHSMASQPNGEGYMKIGPRNNLAVPISTPGTSNKIELFSFIDTTGVVTNLRTITLNQTAGQIYGIEFSPGGNKLFATVRLGPSSSELFEYSIDSLENPHFKQRLPLTLDAGAIQVGPDGQVYVAINNSGNNSSLGSIAANEDTTSVSSFNPAGFALAAGTTSRLGLPNFVQINPSMLGGPAINVTGLCLGDSTRFSATPRDQIDEFNWSVFQGGVLVAQSTDATFASLFATPGNYSVSLRLHNRCAPDTTMAQNFRITNPPADPSGAFVLCHGPVTLDANPTNVAGLTYLWSTGETTETFVMAIQGTKLVDVTDALGCTTTGEFLVADNRPLFDLGPDITMCEDLNTPALNVGNPGMTYQWRVDGVNASTIATQAVDTSEPGEYTYEVTVTDPLTTCSRTEDKVYTFNVAPSVAIAAANTAACGTNTGSVSLTINPTTVPGGPFYQYLVLGPGPTNAGAIDVEVPPSQAFVVPNLGAGTYTVVVTDQVSQCQFTGAIGVSDPAVFTITPTATGVCEPVVYNVTTTASATPVSPLTYTISDGTGPVAGPTTSPTPNFTTPGLMAGSYLLEVRDNSGCINTVDPLTVTTAAPAPVTLTPDLCSLTITASGTGTGTPVWTANPPGAIAGPSTGVTIINLTANSGAATFTYNGTAAGFCPVTETITLNVGNPPNPLLAQTTACAPTVTLSATPVGAFTYRWFRNGTFDASLGGNQLLLTELDNGTDFSVALFEPQSGCTRTSPIHTASVVGTVDAQLTSTPPCQDEQPFTLTASTTATGTVTYNWFRDNAPIAGATAATTSQTDEGEYRVEVHKATCVAEASLDITRSPLPAGQLPNRVIICNDPDNTDPTTRQVDLDPGDFQAYDWSKNQLLLNNTDRVLTADSEGLYEVRLTNSFNCVAIDETEVLSECVPRINAPNVFRPSSSVINSRQTDLGNKDFWIITKFIEDDDFQIFIYNRWGEMVFNSNNRFFKWNGGYNNNVSQPLPPGTYSYIIKYVSSFRQEDGVQEKRGGVALLR